ncbi:hypothetical protein [Chondrinema litorale]|uniref:hypothetical protein n=1 Tax=Chondrinema litorale TaxID=2994555 RepID=UPI002542E241|nr:hypothetical protein [Chondrinema litorale]UZR99392.1 hypothetical protein OQ292_36015 [Chondrinema litorale]
MRQPWIGKMIGYILLGIFVFTLFSSFMAWLTSDIELEKDDYYGEYVIKRDHFRGKQADWIYNHFRFEITNKDSIYFYETDNERILKTYRGTIKTTTPYNSARLIIEMEQPTHHILTSNPTTYRSTWDFYLVFNSPEFHNVFFEKGKWEPLE